MHRFVGTVIKTFPRSARVLVERHLIHPRLVKMVCKREEFVVYDKNEECVIGDTVAIEQISKQSLEPELVSVYDEINQNSTDKQTMAFKMARILKRARIYTDPDSGKIYTSL